MIASLMKYSKFACLDNENYKFIKILFFYRFLNSFQQLNIIYIYKIIRLRDEG